MPWFRKIHFCVYGYLLILLNTLKYPEAYILNLLNMMQSLGLNVLWIIQIICWQVIWPYGISSGLPYSSIWIVWSFKVGFPLPKSMLHIFKSVTHHILQKWLMCQKMICRYYATCIPVLSSFCWPEFLSRVWTIVKGAHNIASWDSFAMSNINCSRGTIGGFDCKLHMPGILLTSYLMLFHIVHLAGLCKIECSVLNRRQIL